MNYQDFIKPELLILIPFLFVVGLFIKKTALKNKYIPFILGGLGIIFSFLIVFTTETPQGTTEIISAIATSIIQGILVAGAAVYGDQLVKQAKKKGDDDNE